MDMDLKGKVALVTGGGSGIGRGIAYCLADEGVDVAIFDKEQEWAKKSADEIKAKGRKSLAIAGNALQSGSVNAAVKQVLDTFGKIDILACSVGGEARFHTEYEEKGQTFLTAGEKQFDDMISLNLNATVLFCRAVAPHMVERKYGKILTVASTAGRTPRGSMGRRGGGGPFMAYGVAKTALIGFTQRLALELGPDNINVNCICPGQVYTNLFVQNFARRPAEAQQGMQAKEAFDKMAVNMMFGRAQTVEDMGYAAVFLCSDKAMNISAQSIGVDGGMGPN